MRTFFFLLLLANAAFFAYSWYLPMLQAGGDTQIMQQQLNPEKIRLLGSDQAGALKRRAEAPAPDASRNDAPRNGAAKSASAACVEWGGVSAADAARAEQVLALLALGDKLSHRRVDETPGYWVYIPPLANRQAAVQKGGELKRLGVDEYFVVSEDSKWRNAVSLGVFKSEDAANARLAALKTKGVRSAIVGARDPVPGKTYFQVRDAAQAQVAKLNELKLDFAGTEVRECPGEDKKN